MCSNYVLRYWNADDTDLADLLFVESFLYDYATIYIECHSVWKYWNADDTDIADLLLAESFEYNCDLYM